MKIKTVCKLFFVPLLVFALFAALLVTSYANDNSHCDYTVNFSYNGNTVKVPGNSQNVDVCSLLSKLGINGAVTCLQAYNEDETALFWDNRVTDADGRLLFEIRTDASNCVFHSYRSFTETFTLVVTTTEGTFAVTVTDPKTDVTDVKIGEIIDCRISAEGYVISSEAQDGNVWYFSTSDESKLKVVNVTVTEDLVHVYLKGVAVGSDLSLHTKTYDAESTSWVDDGSLHINGRYNVIPASEILDFDESDESYPLSTSIQQYYTLAENEDYVDGTKVKVEWTITDLSVFRKESKVWDPDTLTWVHNGANDTVSANETTATFIFTNYSSVKVDAKVEFTAGAGFTPTVAYTGVDATSHITTLGTVVKADKTVDTSIPHGATVTVKITPEKSDFAGKSATSSAGYGTYTVTLCKRTPSVIAPTANELSYTGEPQELITAGSTDGGTLRYALSATMPTEDDYSQTIPTATAAGEYTVFYKVFGDDGCESTVAENIGVIISQLPVNVTAPTANELSYTGAPQELITPGDTSGGTLKYAVSEDEDEPADEAYAEDVPTATVPGEYSVWYKSFGDEIYVSSTAEMLTVTLNKAEQDAPEGSFDYDEPTSSITVTVTNDSSCQGQIRYSIDGETWQDSNEFSGISEKPDAVYVSFTGNDFYEENSSTLEEADCLAKGTKITMADGSTKNIEDIAVGDEVLTYNHEKGRYEAQKVYLAWASAAPKTAFTLHFTNGIAISVIGDHCFFEKESLTYVAVFESNAEKFIGKHFYNAAAGRYEELLSVTHGDTPVDYYEIYTGYNANCIAENMLNVPLDASEVLNLYRFNEDLTIDHEQLASDIAAYGIFEYTENDRYTEELYDMLAWKYVYVMVGKGLGTIEEFRARQNAFLGDEITVLGENV